MHNSAAWSPREWKIAGNPWQRQQQLEPTSWAGVGAKSNLLNIGMLSTVYILQGEFEGSAVPYPVRNQYCSQGQEVKDAQRDPAGACVACMVGHHKGGYPCESPHALPLGQL